MHDFTRADKRDEALREIEYRKRVYWRLVAEKRMTRAAADRRIAIMQAIADDYREPDLFGGANG